MTTDKKAPDKKTKRVAPKRPAQPPAHPDPAGDAGFWREMTFKGHREKRHEWLRLQLLGWLAHTLAEIKGVQAELRDADSALCAALTHDECWAIDDALETAWGALSSTTAKPKVLPAFLTSMPAFVPTSPTGTEGGK